MDISVSTLPSPTLKSFLHGDIGSIMHATLNPKIFMTWLHANEALCPSVAHHIQHNAPQLFNHIDYLCGNIKAAKESGHDNSNPLSGRYTKDGTDLNRSFDKTKNIDSYEARRAQSMLKTISMNNYRYVLDLHTTYTDIDKCIIVSESSIGHPAVREIINASDITRIVIMPANIANDGLIGHVPYSVSIEYNKEISQEKGVVEVMGLLERLIAGVPRGAQDRELYHVNGTIGKDMEINPRMKNFELTGDGYYPILFGNNSYSRDKSKKYVGFTAAQKENQLI